MIQACLNGRRTRADHPRIPLTPEELAREAKGAVEAGAQALHVHPRGPDGFETLDAEPRAATLRALRAACPGVEISVTTGLWITRDADRRLELIAGWTELPDVASVNVSETGAAELVRTLVGRRIGVEIGIATAADARTLVELGVAPSCKRLLIEVEGDPSEGMVEIAAIDAVLGPAGIDLPRLEHGSGRATYAIIDQAVRLGRDYRIGFEDTLVLPDGRPARSNADLILACRARTERK
jgi:uncharacterized protein (DUF849 family)